MTQATPTTSATTGPTHPRVMRAVLQERFGVSAAEVLSTGTTTVPEPGSGEVLVRVHAAGVDRGVWHLMAGLPYPVRLAGYGLRSPKNKTPGMDLSGVVEAVGDEVVAFAVGDEVMGIGVGTFAEFAVAEVAKLVPKPDGLSHEQAASVAISGLTALQAVRDQAEVLPGHRVLVLGASGGVGSFAVQIAKAFGADVTGECTGSKTDFVRSLGADHVIDHTTTDVTRGPLRYDAILDGGGNRSLSDLRRILTDDGTLVIIGGEGGGRWLGGTDRQLRAMLVSPFVSQRLRAFVSSENAEDLGAITVLIESGKVTPALDRVFPLDHAPAAIDHLVAGNARGKVVVSVG